MERKPRLGAVVPRPGGGPWPAGGRSPGEPAGARAGPGKRRPGPHCAQGAGLEDAGSAPRGLLPHLQPAVGLGGHPDPLKPLTAPPPSKAGRSEEGLPGGGAHWGLQEAPGSQPGSLPTDAPRAASVTRVWEGSRAGTHACFTNGANEPCWDFPGKSELVRTAGEAGAPAFSCTGTSGWERGGGG